MKILDILLYPKSLFTKITDKKLTLILGILFIGIVDVVFTIGITELPQYFNLAVKPARLFAFRLPDLISGIPSSLVLNSVYTGIFIIFLGALDVLFFTIPLYDLFKFLSRKFKFPNTGSLIKVAKVYFLSHIMVIPINVIVILLIYYYKLGESNNPYLVYPVWIYLEILMPIWFSAIIVRGIYVLYNLDKRFRGLVFIGIYMWNYLLGIALGLVNGLLMGLLLK